MDDMEFRINARMRLDLLVVQGGLCQHQRRQKPDGTAGAKCLGHLGDRSDNASSEERERAQLHDVGCHIIHNACCAAGLKSKREVIVPTLATEKLTEAGVDVDASMAPTAAAHSTRLHSRRRRSSSLLFSDAQRTR